jgi:hypothetical protein
MVVDAHGDHLPRIASRPQQLKIELLFPDLETSIIL